MELTAIFHFGYLIAVALFACAAGLFHLSTRTGIAKLLNTQENILSILIMVCGMFGLAVMFGVMARTGLYGTAPLLLQHIFILVTSLIFMIMTHLDYSERRALRMRHGADLLRRRGKK